jgi:choice-of-anchor A domain-containing protein
MAPPAKLPPPALPPARNPASQLALPSSYGQIVIKVIIIETYMWSFETEMQPRDVISRGIQKDTPKVNRRRQLPLYLVVSLLAVGPARAQTLTPTQILQQFNAVIFGNLSTTSDIEGRAVIGGNLASAQTLYINPGSEAASTFAALTVYGASNGGGSTNINNGGAITVVGLNSATLQINGGSSVFIGGANSGGINVNGGTATIGINGNNSATVTANGGGTIKINGTSGNINGNGASTTTVDLPSATDLTGNINNATVNYGPVSLSNSLPNFATTFQTPMTTLSTQLESQAANSTVSTANSTVTFNATPNAAGQAVFAISSSVLTAGNDTIAFNANGATTMIVNVSCGSANCSITMPSSDNEQNPTTNASEILWNFYNAGTLNFGSEFGGSVLAPDATVTNSNPIDGDLIANLFSGGGELHNYPFTGNLTFAVPEPASIALLGISLVGLIAARRRPAKPVA